MIHAIKDLLKGANPTIILLLIFLIWQVVNHIPTQIKEVKTEIKELRTEVKTEIKELNNKIDRMDDKIEKNHNELKNIIIEYLGNKKE